LIYGARRLFVARHLNRPLLVEVRHLSDNEAIVAMDLENRQRTDISPYERGIAYATWLRSGQFKSQQHLARTLQVSASQVSRLLALARLPAVVLSAFRRPTDIREGWGVELAEAFTEPERREQLIARARDIAKVEPRPTSEEIFRLLSGASLSLPRVKRWARDEVIRDQHGRALFRVQQRRMSICFMLPVQRASERVLEDCCVCLARILKDAGRSGMAAENLRGHPESRLDGGGPAPLSAETMGPAPSGC
jgi:ParB family chromosome partitioning protein